MPKTIINVEYRFQNIGGQFAKVQESYASQTCPSCGEKHKTDSRVYKCSDCGFAYDRDGVGSINIWGLAQNVSLRQVLGVVGSLTEPRSWKYHSNFDCVVFSQEKTMRTPRF